MRLLFIGESLVLAGAIELARGRGDDIVGVFATAPVEAAAMARAGLPVADANGSAAGFVAAHPCDVLLSIVNPHILDAATLATPRIAAVNYHNAPLPAYAGLWATAWAVLNGEPEHGITWHLMEPGIDTGPILAQRRFALAPDETTASLNVRCTAAALESLGGVLDALARGDAAGKPQDATRRSYHKSSDIAPHGGLIDWRWPAERVLRLVRACDWGPTPSAFGKATLMMPTGDAVAIVSAEHGAGNAAPGIVIAADGNALTIACGDGALRVTLEAGAEIAAGTQLPLLDLDGAAVTPPRTAPQPIQSGRDPEARPTVPHMIAALAAADPGAPAIEENGRVISRSSLAKRADALAGALVAAGLRTGDGVGILLPAGADFVAAALGAMRAGGAYVPLDPASPPARHRVETAEAGITHVLTRDPVAAERVLPDIVVMSVDEVPAVAATAAPPDPDDIAYRIFTSGSTGHPKAVEIPHSALANLCAHYCAALPMDAADRMTMLAHPTFDASVADIWPVLAAGGVLLVPPPHILLDPMELIAWLAATRATAAFVPTAIAEKLIGLPWPPDVALRSLLTGGDTLHARPSAGLPFRLINTYGPTENTVDSLWAVVGPGGGRPPIGRPIAGVTATLVDEAGRPVRRGRIGELVLGGAQVARGYRGRADLTAERFERDPAPPHGRRYRSGDLARIGPDGDYEFHGRIDDQVQLRGIRIEPGEIEALLRADARVAEAACVPLRAGTSVTGLAVHVVPSREAASDAGLADDLRAMLGAQLPPAVVPGRIVLHAALPRTAAGKVDRTALAAVADIDPGGDGGGGADPVRAAWLRALHGREAGDEESFWDLGGDSLSAIALLTEIEHIVGVRVPIGLFLADPSLAGLKRAIAARRNPVVVRLSEGKGPPLVLWYGASGDVEHYQHLVAALDGRDIIGLLSPGLADQAAMQAGIEEAAAAGLAALAQFGLFEPPVMLAYSWSGLLAFEAARQLALAGTPSPFVGLVGSLPPFARRRRAARLAHFLRWAPHSAWAIARGHRKRPRRLISGIRRLRRLFAAEGDLPPRPGWIRQPIEDAHIAMGKCYRPPCGTPPIRLCLFRELAGRDRIDHLGYVAFEKDDFGWSAWAGAKPDIRWIEADHSDVMKGAQVRALAALIGEELDRLA